MFQELSSIEPLFWKMSARPPGAGHAHQQEFLNCPICHMGSGRETRASGRNSIKSETTATGSSFIPSYEAIRAAKFQKPLAFDRHITERHEKIFQSVNSSDYICYLCPCDCIAYGASRCTARFSTDTHGNLCFLDHLETSHAGDPDSLAWWQHLCPPSTTADYKDPEVRKVAESFYRPQGPQGSQG